MPDRNAWSRHAGKWLALVLVVAAGGALYWHYSAPSLARVGAPVTVSPVATNKHTPSTLLTQQAANLPLPTSLAGSTPPRLPLDALGRLARTHAVKDFFDYFLTARSELAPAAMDSLVREAIAVQLGHSAAADEAFAVWQRYNGYLKALAQLPSPPPLLQQGGAVDYDTLFALIDQRAALGDRIMGEWSQPFFADDLLRERIALQRRRIGSDTALSAAEKAKKLSALDQMAPAQDQALRQQIDNQQAQADKLKDIESENLSPDAMRAQISQEFGPDVADRAMSLRQPDDAFQAQYSQYAAQRSQLQQQNLSPDQYAAQVAQLRQQYFSSPSEIARAASFDRGSPP